MIGCWGLNSWKVILTPPLLRVDFRQKFSIRFILFPIAFMSFWSLWEAEWWWIMENEIAGRIIPFPLFIFEHLMEIQLRIILIWQMSFLCGCWEICESDLTDHFLIVTFFSDFCINYSTIYSVLLVVLSISFLIVYYCNSNKWNVMN